MMFSIWYFLLVALYFFICVHMRSGYMMIHCRFDKFSVSVSCKIIDVINCSKNCVGIWFELLRLMFLVKSSSHVLLLLLGCWFDLFLYGNDYCSLFRLLLLNLMKVVHITLKFTESIILPMS